MTIDRITIRLYTCCKCGHQWTNWDSKNKIEGRTPLNCPSCRNIRWNQKYTDKDLELFRRLEDQHMVKKNVGKRESAYAKMLGRKEYITTSYIDFIAHDFLYQMVPQPEIFEIKQVLKILKTRIEERHELMLSMIRDRIENKDKYEKEYFSKYSKWYDTRQKGSKYMIYGIGRRVYERRKFSGCKHKEDLDILLSLYKHQYFGFKWLSYAIEPFDMDKLERLSDSDSQKVYAEAERILTAEAKATGQRVKETQQ